MASPSNNEPQGKEVEGNTTTAPAPATTSQPATPDTGGYPCFALNCDRVFDTLKGRMDHGRAEIMDDDHCAEFIHCFAPSRIKDEPKGLCTYTRQAGPKEDQIRTHLRDKTEVDVLSKRSQGVDHHLHLTEVERDGYWFIALKLNWFARILLDRPASSGIWFRPTDNRANFFEAVPEVEAIYRSYQMRVLAKCHEKSLAELSLIM